MVSNLTAPCGPQFFSSADLSTIQQFYGPQQGISEVFPTVFCSYNASTSTWANAVSTASTKPSQGGDVVLVEHCGPNDPVCPNPDAPHSLSAFRAFPAPDPAAYTLKPFGTAGAPVQNGGLLIFNDGRCYAVVFDLRNDEWFIDSVVEITALLQGATPPQPNIPTGPSYTLAANVKPPLPVAADSSVCTGSGDDG